jgi:hypothetical protein
MDRIAPVADITLTSTVVAFDNKLTGNPDFAVMRQALQVDPVLFAPETSNHRKSIFVWGIENALRINGVPAYYFTISAADEAWQKTVEGWGAEKLNPQPVYFYKRMLQEKV